MKKQSILKKSISSGDTKMIFSWDLSKVLKQLKERKKWNDKRCNLAEFEYRRFMTLIVANPNVSFSPSSDVDEMWHTHILHTADYRQFCDTVAGYYIDHHPFLESDRKKSKSRQAIETTMKFYREQFGEPNAVVWPWAKSLEKVTGDCVGCNSPVKKVLANDCVGCGSPRVAHSKALVNDCVGCGSPRSK